VHLNLQVALAERIQLADTCPAGTVGHDAQLPGPVGECTAASGHEHHDGSGDRQVVPVTDLHDRRDGGVLVDDVDAVLAFDHHDLQAGVLRRRG
jgi:hypothetical protein